MIRAINAPEYLLTARRLFVVVSALTIVWVYLAALVPRLKVWQATVAAAVMGLSWEFAYHSRWVATDCIVVQFSALTLLFLSCFLRFGRVAWLYQRPSPRASRLVRNGRRCRSWSRCSSAAPGSYPGAAWRRSCCAQGCSAGRRSSRTSFRRRRRCSSPSRSWSSFASSRRTTRTVTTDTA